MKDTCSSTPGPALIGCGLATIGAGIKSVFIFPADAVPTVGFGAFFEIGMPDKAMATTTGPMRVAMETNAWELLLGNSQSPFSMVITQAWQKMRAQERGQNVVSRMRKLSNKNQ